MTTLAPFRHRDALTRALRANSPEGELRLQGYSGISELRADAAAEDAAELVALPDRDDPPNVAKIAERRALYEQRAKLSDTVTRLEALIDSATANRAALAAKLVATWSEPALVLAQDASYPTRRADYQANLKALVEFNAQGDAIEAAKAALDAQVAALDADIEAVEIELGAQEEEE